MASQSDKRDLADFFKPYARATPAKRPSPSPDPRERPHKTKKVNPSTPSSTSRFKDVGVSPLKSPFGPRSGASVKIPIRSPRPDTIAAPSTSASALLFASSKVKQRHPETSTAALSFSDIPASGQNTLKDGKIVAIRDSDDDDSESLESLEDIFGRKKVDTTSSSSPMESSTEKREVQPKSLLSVFSRGRSDPLVGKEKLRAIFAREREHKFDISYLMGDHLDDQEIDSNLSKARQHYKDSEQEVELSNRQSEVDRDLLVSIINSQDENGDETSRVMNAVERTDALSSDKVFSFFRPEGLTDWHDRSPFEQDFPNEDIPHGLWKAGDAEARSRAYLSGYMAEAAASGQVADSVLKWTFETLVQEQRDALRVAYMQCLKQASRYWTRTNLTASDVQTIFWTLGAKEDAIRDGSEIIPNQFASARGQRDPRYLISVLELFNAVTYDLDFTALSKLTSTIARLAIDTNAMSDGRVSSAVEDLISRLLGIPNSQARTHVAERILSEVGEHLQEPSLQAQLLRHILPVSGPAATLRVRLAQRFLLHSSLQIQDLDEPAIISLPALQKYLSSPVYDIVGRSREGPVDYARLLALAQLVDIAISDGGRPASFDSRSQEIAFNGQVDALADRVKSIFASIADTGASHMRRTEAKETLGALQYRLLYAVRTQPRPKKNVFGGRADADYEAQERSKGVLKDFLAGKNKGGMNALEEKNAIRSSSAVVGSERSEDEMLIRKQLDLSQ